MKDKSMNGVLYKNFLWPRKNGIYSILLLSSGIETKVVGRRGINTEGIC